MTVIDKIDDCLFLLNQFKTTKLEQEKLALMGFDLLAEDTGCLFSEPLQTVLNWRMSSDNCNDFDKNSLEAILGDCPLIEFPETPINTGFFLGAGIRV